MRERRLLERIAGWDESGERTSRVQADILIRSVVDHLRRLLNTRQGSVQIDPLFGVPDFTNAAGGLVGGLTHEATRGIEEEIHRMVRRYEPRLKSPKVTLNPNAADTLAINFDLQGTLDIDHRAMPLQLSATVGANGKVDID
jgi:type VI secretion system protein